MDFGLVAAFLVAVAAGLWSWKSMQPDDKYGGANTDNASEALFLRKNPKKGGKGGKKPKKDKNGSQSGRRASNSRNSSGGKDADAESTFSTATTTTTKSVKSTKPEAPAPKKVQAVVVETPVVEEAVTPSGTVSIKQVTTIIKKALDGAGEKQFVVLEQLKLMPTDQFKEVNREKKNMEKTLERERGESVRTSDELKRTQDTLKLAMRENNEYKTKNKMVADRARADVSKQMLELSTSNATLKSECATLKKKLDGFNSNEDALTKKVESLQSLNTILTGAMNQRAIAVQPATPDVKLTAELAQLKQNLKQATEASETQAKQAATDLAVAKKQAKTAENRLKKANQGQDKLKIDLEQARHASSEATAAGGKATEGVQEELEQAKKDHKEVVLQCEQAVGNANELKAQIEKLQSQLAGSTKDAVGAKAALAEAQSANTQAGAATSEAAAKQVELSGQVELLKQQNEALQTTSEAAGTELSEYKATLSEIQVRLETMEATEQELRDENAGLKEAAAAVAGEKVQEAGKAEKAGEAAEELKASLLKAAEMENGIGQGDSWVQCFVERVGQRSQGEIDELKAEVKSLRNGEEELKKVTGERDTIQSSLDAQNTKMQTMVLSLDKITAQIDSDTNEMQKVTGERDQAKDELNKAHAEAERLKAELAKHKEAMQQVDHKAVEIKQSFEKDMAVKDVSLSALKEANTKLEKEIQTMRDAATRTLTQSTASSNNTGAGEGSSPASEKWVVLNGEQQRQGVQSLSSSETSDSDAANGGSKV